MKRRDWFIPLILLVIIGIVIWLSPEEKTLGARIKIVYIHVAFVWAGLAGILLTGILSIGAFWQPFAKRLGKLLPLMSFTAFLWFGIGFILSIAAANINWGGFDWTEARAVAALRIISVSLIVQVLAYMVKNIRFRAGLYISLVFVTMLIRSVMTDAIHPTNAIFSSDSSSFAITTLTLMGLVVLLATWFMSMSYHQVKEKRITA